MLKQLFAGGLVLFGCVGLSMADRYDRGDRYQNNGYRGGSYDRGDRYSGHSNSRWSVGFGYSSGGYYGGDRASISIGYRSGGFSGYYSQRVYSPPVCAPVYVAPRPVYIERPVYVSPQPVYIERPVYVAPPVVYQPAPVVVYPSSTYYYNNGNCNTYSGGNVRYYYGR